MQERLLLYGLGLLVVVPGGLVLGLAYRGRRRPELTATIVVILCFYVFQAYGSAESGFPKSLVIGLRYFAPLLPVAGLRHGRALPRWLEAWSERVGRVEGWLSVAKGLWLAGVLVASFVVHVALDRWAGSQTGDPLRARAVRAPEAVLVANDAALEKFIDDSLAPVPDVGPRQTRRGVGGRAGSASR